MSAAAIEPAFRTRSGRRVAIRPIRPDDKAALEAAFEHLGAETRYRRFLRPVKHLTSRDLAYFTELDHAHHEALVAETERGELAGVARYVELADRPGVAEIAVTITDAWQRDGLGTELAVRLTDRARAAGIHRLLGFCLVENSDMRDLMTRLGEPAREALTGEGVVEIEVELPVPDEPERVQALLGAAARGEVERLRAAGADERPADAGLLDRLLPDYDATRVERRAVAGSPAEVYAAVRAADFMRAWRESAAVRILFAARSGAERVAAALGLGSGGAEPVAEPEAMRLADMPARGEWVLLGEDPPDEIAFGTIGRFWGGETRWATIAAADFAAFDRPGFAKIACSFRLRAGGPGETLVIYESRTRATDPASRRAFMRYWRLVSPGVGIVMRSMLRVIAGERRGFRAFNRTVNPVVAWILRSRAHRLLSGSLALITVTGRRTGRRITVPVVYRREGREVAIRVGRPERKTWWRNLRGGERDVELLIRGERLAGRASLHERAEVSVTVALS